MNNISTQEKYDAFLALNKNYTIKRIDDFINPSTGIKHECLDKECARIWKPKPSQMLDDDYYCPSCVLHHRNNMKRFKSPRLVWTKEIPNTFYVFKIVDPKFPDLEIAKFGRTQNANSLKRYPNSEIKNYKMELLCELRGKLITMTRIENYWKTTAKKLDIFHDFSVGAFHGKSECILSKDLLDLFLISTYCIYNDDSNDPDDECGMLYI
jgi:hypothetical protein